MRKLKILLYICIMEKKRSYIKECQVSERMFGKYRRRDGRKHREFIEHLNDTVENEIKKKENGED